MLNSKNISQRPGLIEDCSGVKFERINTQPYQLHNAFVPEFYDLTDLSMVPHQYLAMSEMEVSKIKRETFLFKNVLKSAYSLLHEDEYYAARLWIRIWKRVTGKQYLMGNWHSHNCSKHYGIQRDTDRILMVSTSNPTSIIKPRNLLERTEVVGRDHFYPDLSKKIKDGSIPSSKIIAAKPAQFLEIRENEAHVSPVETEEIEKDFFRILAVILIPHQREQLNLQN